MRYINVVEAKLYSNIVKREYGLKMCTVKM